MTVDVLSMHATQRVVYVGEAYKCVGIAVARQLHSLLKLTLRLIKTAYINQQLAADTKQIYWL